MPDLAQHRIERLVSLVAWMSQRDSEGPVPYRRAARHLGVTEQTLREDLDILRNLTESYKPWLASLSLAFTARGFMLGSQAKFRRPLRLNREEGLALVLGLLGTPKGRDLAQRLGQGLGADPDPGAAERSWAFGPTPQEWVAQVVGVAREARDRRRKLRLAYCGWAGEPSQRVIQVHQVVHAGGTWYLVAWCERAGGPRHFRAERVLEIELLEESFTPRPDFPRVRKPADLLAAADYPLATVAFSPRIARWLRERYPDGQTAPDGRYLVRLPVADPHWLAREVLQYGAEAEVLEPEAMRLFLRQVIGQ